MTKRGRPAIVPHDELRERARMLGVEGGIRTMQSWECRSDAQAVLQASERDFWFCSERAADGSDGKSARPETLEACWRLIEALDVEIVGAMNDEAAAKLELRGLRTAANELAAKCEEDAALLLGFYDPENQAARAAARMLRQHAATLRSRLTGDLSSAEGHFSTHARVCNANASPSGSKNAARSKPRTSRRKSP